MLIERHITLVFAAISAVLVLPQHASAPPPARTGVLLGAGIGALETWGGAIVASDHPVCAARVLGIGLWSLVALGLSGAVLCAALHSPGGWHRAAFAVAAVLPIAGPVAVLLRKK